MNQREPLSEHELAEAREEIRPLTDGFDLLGDHVVITDAKGNILYANKAAEQHTGFSLSEMLGKNPGDLWGGIMEKKNYEAMWHVIKVEKKPYRGEVQNRNKAGELYWQELSIFPVLDEQGEAKFFIAIEPDITIRKVFEKNTKQYMQEMERLTSFLSTSSMQIRDLNKEIAELKIRLQNLSNP